jgi:hypothetical protein
VRLGALAAPALAGLVGAASCKPNPKHYVERIEMSGTTVADNGVLKMTPEQVEVALRQAVHADPSFVLSDTVKPPRGAVPVRLTLDLAFTREAQKSGRPGTYAEVGASLTLRRRLDDVSLRYEVMGLGEVPEPSDDPEARRLAMRRALETALKEAVAAAHLQLAALEKPDPELLKDVSSADARVREFAIRTLSDRKNPGVADALLEQLKGEDPDQIRRAMGALVELKERRAVPPLIDLARGKDLGFLREILFALGEIGGEEAQAYLYTVSEGHDQPAIREAARQALDELSNHGTRAGRERRSDGTPGEEILP